MKLLAVNDTEIKKVKGKLAIKDTDTYELFQKHSKFKGYVSQEVLHLIECFRSPRSLHEAKINLETKGYRFSGLAESKLINTVTYLVQVGVLVPVMDDQYSEFSPIINADPDSIRAIDLGTFDLDALAQGVVAFKDNHPYPSNALDTLSGNSRGSSLSKD